MLAAAERRLTRFGLDLHDGPVQEASALLAEVRMFREQLEGELGENPNRETLLGRADDLEHLAKSLEADIREVSRTAGAPAAAEGELEPVLRAEAKAFAQATGTMPELTVVGPVDASTPSQRIALLRGVQEALRNIREHAEATAVSITVDAPPDQLLATVADNGVGFDSAAALARAEQEGHFGMRGIKYRARLLGGNCEIESQPGGPTLVRIALPRWESGSGPGAGES